MDEFPGNPPNPPLLKGGWGDSGKTEGGEIMEASKKFQPATDESDLLYDKFSDLHFKREGLKKFANLVRTALNDLGIAHIQFNCINKSVLIDAQKHPENYPTLMVRVAGYSAYFTDIGKDIQDDIISRSEHRFN